MVISALLCLAPAVLAQDGETIVAHGLSAFGDLKYAADFTHFDYVNPDAPKGGKLSTLPTSGMTTFDSFNGFILKGDSVEGVTFSQAQGFGGIQPASLTFDSLMVKSGDEPDSVYGLVAYEAEYPNDRSWVIFRMRPEARFQDGSPLTAEDVVFTFDMFKEKGHPILRQLLRDVVGAEALGPHEVKFTFAENVMTRDLPMLVAELAIQSKAYYATRAFDESTLEPPLGSGPYTIGNFKQGSFVEYERDPDYWAKDLPVNVGRWNFDTVRFDYFRDRNVAFQAFTANEYDFREEFTSRIWMTQYEFPAIRDGRVIQRVLPNPNPDMYGWFMNTRRGKFADVRVRDALNLALDFEWLNKTQFYEMYQRSASYWQGSPDLQARGPAEGRELDILERFRGQVPDALFDRAWEPPVSDGSGRDRALLSQARDLLAAAGWKQQDGQLVNAAGEPFTVEFLIYEPPFERIIAPYVQNLKLLGIDASLRLVDPAQYQRRLDEFDFDMLSRRYISSNTPGIGLRNTFGSASANVPGTNNHAGISDPVVDALIETIVESTTREDLNASVRALDRVLREGRYWVPSWFKAAHNIAYWDKFGYPDVKPKYQRGIVDTWWATEGAAVPAEGD